MQLHCLWQLSQLKGLCMTAKILNTWTVQNSMLENYFLKIVMGEVVDGVCFFYLDHFLEMCGQLVADQMGS